MRKDSSLSQIEFALFSDVGEVGGRRSRGSDYERDIVARHLADQLQQRLHDDREVGTSPTDPVRKEILERMVEERTACVRQRSTD